MTTHGSLCQLDFSFPPYEGKKRKRNSSLKVCNALWGKFNMAALMAGQ